MFCAGSSNCDVYGGLSWVAVIDQVSQHALYTCALLQHLILQSFDALKPCFRLVDGCKREATICMMTSLAHLAPTPFIFCSPPPHPLPTQKAIAEEYAEHDWSALAAPGAKKGLNSLTIPTLKVYLQHHGLRTTGNKGEIVQRIQEHVLKSSGS